MPDASVVVLAGGTSRRFGSDKLSAPLTEGVEVPTVLDTLLASLPPVDVVVVGPPRPTVRPVRWVLEHPRGGGPAAALVAGLRAAAGLRAGDTRADGWVAVVPGDAPGAAGALGALETGLEHALGAVAAVAVDAAGREQPLQLVLTGDGVSRLLAAVGDGDGRDLSVRPLVRDLDPVRVRVPPGTTWDVDTPDQLVAWRLRDSTATVQVVDAVAAAARAVGPSRPVVVALDGPSGAGKSVLAQAVALHTGATVLDGDDFYAPRLAREGLAAAQARSAADLAGDGVIDWRRLRAEALEPLVAGRRARYRPYDWGADDGRLAERDVVLVPSPVLVVDGVYSGRPELVDLVDLRVLVGTPPAVRSERLVARGDGDDPRWLAVWSSAEHHYFTHVSPPDGYDLQVSGDATAPAPDPRVEA